MRIDRTALRVCPGVLTLVLGLAACAGEAGPQACADADVHFDNAVCLELGQSGANPAQRALLQEEVERTLAVVASSLPITDLGIAVIADPAEVIPEVGMGGFTPDGNEVRLFIDMGRPDVEAVIRRELMPLLAHELHDAMRWRTVGYGGTLLEAAVSEGLADHFAVEVAGIQPSPWSTALDAEQLVIWLPQVTSRTSGGYDHAAWFFGTTPAIPRWTGYAVGFALVAALQEQQGGRSAASLVGEPASSFVLP